MANQIEEYRGQIERMRPEFLKALPEHVSVDRFMRVTMTAISMEPKLQAVDQKTLFAALLKCASDGLIPDGREAVLSVFNSKGVATAVYMPMIGGILKKMRNSGELLSIAAHVVYEHDKFDYELGDAEHIYHKPAMGERGKVICVYAIGKTKDGGIYREVMDVGEVEKVRSVSKAAQSGPWVQWWDEMAEKTVLKRLSKRMPMSTDLEDLLHRGDDTDGAAAIVHSSVAPAKQLQSAPLNATAELKPAEPKAEPKAEKQSRTKQVAEALKNTTPAAGQSTPDDVGSFDDVANTSQPAQEAPAPAQAKEKLVGWVNGKKVTRAEPEPAPTVAVEKPVDQKPESVQEEDIPVEPKQEPSELSISGKVTRKSRKKRGIEKGAGPNGEDKILYAYSVYMNNKNDEADPKYCTNSENHVAAATKFEKSGRDCILNCRREADGSLWITTVVDPDTGEVFEA